VLTYLTDQRLSNQRPWAPSVCAPEPALLSALPTGVASVHVAPVSVVHVGVAGVNGVSVPEGVSVAQRQLSMQPSRTPILGTSGFTAAAKDSPTASKRIDGRVDGASGVPPRGRPV